jgi:quercetin dioxygenase-like cupin family protein
MGKVSFRLPVMGVPLKNNSYLRISNINPKNILMSNSFETANILNFAQLVEYSANGIISKRVIDRSSGTITLFSFDKHQKLSEHTAPFDALVQVIEGQAEIIIAGKKFLVSTNESIILPAGVIHAVNAVEKFKMLLTMIKEK